jgi:AraC family transcriptional regulator of adaptative response / DNA-3-methyladenine glycosylase II
VPTAESSDPGAGLDPERCYRAVLSRDARFDGWFVTGVVTTGIYCRPSCPAMTP